MSRRLEHDWFARDLPANVRIGERTWLHSAFAFLHYASEQSWGVDVGHDTGLYKGTFFDLGPGGELRIGSFSTLVNVIISTNGRVTIGDYVFIAHEVLIADHPIARPAGPDRERAPSQPIDIGDDVWIGASAVILGGARIGAGAIVGAATVVNSDVPPYSIVAGNPARIVGSTRPPS